MSKAGGKRYVPITGLPKVGSPGYQFHAETAKAVKALPPYIVETLKLKGVRIVAAKNASDILRGDIDATPRGSLSGSLREVGAAYDPNTKTAFVAELCGPVKSRFPTRNPAGSMRHEIGHAVDDNFLDHQISQREDFKAAYREDLRQLMDGSGSSFGDDGEYSLKGLAAELSYFIQPERNQVSGRTHASDAGYSESFAEGFAVIHGGGTYGKTRFEAAFPATLKKIKELIIEKKSRKGKG